MRRSDAQWNAAFMRQKAAGKILSYTLMLSPRALCFDRLDSSYISWRAE
jgi:hypothetical protein